MNTKILRLISKPFRFLFTEEISALNKKILGLEENENIYSGLFKNSTMGLYQTTPDGRILSANPALIKMLNFDSLEDLLRRDLSKGSYVDDKKREKFKKIIKEEGEITNFESEWYTKDGEIIYVNEGARAVKDSKGKIIRYDGAVENITHKKKNEIELIKAKVKAEESDRLKTAFLHNISHEIRTPMNAIIGFSGLINEPEITPKDRQYFTTVIEQSCESLLAIITDLINIATVESGQEKIHKKDINLNVLCKQIFDQFSLKVRDKGLSFNYKTELHDKESFIVSDETKIRQIINNLLFNALKFTTQGYIIFGYIVKVKYIEFYVEDTGIGIPKEMFKEIFKRFQQIDNNFSRLNKGTGLGLAIAHAYVKLLGGNIWLTSELDKGSKFYFTIPYKKVSGDNTSGIQNTHEQIMAIDKPKTILVVEDEDLNSQLIDNFLRELNFTIIHAITGFEAIEICKSNEQVDLVLMDLKMPGMNGYDSTRLIREFLPDLPIIAQTAYSAEADIQKAITCGCNDFIIKPFSRKVLLSKISENLKRT